LTIRLGFEGVSKAFYIFQLIQRCNQHYPKTDLFFEDRYVSRN